MYGVLEASGYKIKEKMILPQATERGKNSINSIIYKLKYCGGGCQEGRGRYLPIIYLFNSFPKSFGLAYLLSIRYLSIQYAKKIAIIPNISIPGIKVQ